MSKANKIIVDKRPQDKLIKLQEFKSYYYLMNAKPDSRVIMSEDVRVVSRSNILELNEQINRKLDTHDICTYLAEIKFELSDNLILDFKSWEEFKDFDFNVSNYVIGIEIKWDIFLNLKNYRLPQRHTVKLKLGYQAKPGEMFEAIFMSDSDIEARQIRSNMICRVDYVNSVVSSELANIVNNWYNSLPKVDAGNKTYDFFDKYYNKIANLSDPLTSIFGIGLGILFIKSFSKSLFGISVYDSFSFLNALVGISTLWSFVYLSNYFGTIIEDYLHRKLRKLHKQNRFLFTSGDKNRNKEILKTNRSAFISWLIDFSIQLVSNIAVYYFGLK